MNWSQSLCQNLLLFRLHLRKGVFGTSIHVQAATHLLTSLTCFLNTAGAHRLLPFFCPPSSHANGEGGAWRGLVGAHHAHLTEALLLAKEESHDIWRWPLWARHTLALLISPLPRKQLCRLSWWHIWTSRRLKPVKYSGLVCEPVNLCVHSTRWKWLSLLTDTCQSPFTAGV